MHGNSELRPPEDAENKKEHAKKNESETCEAKEKGTSAAEPSRDRFLPSDVVRASLCHGTLCLD